MTAISYGPAARSQVLDSGRAARAGVQLAVLALAWGALSFGGVYAWGYWPLAIACAVSGVVGLLAGRPAAGAMTHRGLTISLALLAAGALVQLLPLPAPWLSAITPHTVALLTTLDPMFAAGLTTAHAMSITPSATVVAIGLFASFAVFMLGLTRLFSRVGARRFAEMLTLIGVVLALAGIIQKPLFNGRIFGFWTPIGRGDPFGPFVNKNHFAGWMLLALPVTLGLLCAGLERGMRGVKRDWRSRLLWLASPDASRLILIAAAAMIMTLSVVLTMSRSGMTALSVAVLAAGAVLIRMDGAVSRKVAGAAYVILVVVTVAAAVGVDAIAARFSNTTWAEFGNRTGAWADAAGVARSFPVVGTGLNTYGVAMLVYQRHDLTSHYAQSHSDYLQLAAEGGLLLMGPAVLSVVFLLAGVGRGLRSGQRSTGWWLRAGAATSLLAIALQETVEFSLQMPGNAALFAAICAIALHESASAAPTIERDGLSRDGPEGARSPLREGWSAVGEPRRPRTTG